MSKSDRSAARKKESVVEASERPLCRVITDEGDGRRCTNTRMTGMDVCGSHLRSDPDQLVFVDEAGGRDE